MDAGNYTEKYSTVFRLSVGDFLACRPMLKYAIDIPVTKKRELGLHDNFSSLSLECKFVYASLA